MSTELATYTIAHDSGIDVSKYLTPDETARVRELVTQLRSSTPSATPNGRMMKRAATPKRALVTIGDLGIQRLPGMSAAHATEARQMANVYAAMYVFENSLRDVIERVLRHRFGNAWWTSAVPQKIQDVATQRKTDERKDPWHGKRGSRPIDYVDLSALAKVVQHQWKLFEKIFPTPAWIEALVTHDMNVSRRVVAHMNPLATDDIRNVENALRKYEKVLKANAGEIP